MHCFYSNRKSLQNLSSQNLSIKLLKFQYVFLLATLFGHCVMFTYITLLGHRVMDKDEGFAIIFIVGYTIIASHKTLSN